MNGKRILNGARTVFALIGVFFTGWFLLGLAQGVAGADETTGGYEYPFTGWTGTPTDYGSWHGTPEGLAWPGGVADQLLNCTTGQLVIRTLGFVDVNFRPFSDRAKVVHQPQMACRERGFDTSAWDSINDPDGLYSDLQS